MMAYQPGSFFLTTVTGAAGFAIGLGQTLAGAPSRYEHAGLILDADGTTLEAEPGGAKIGNISTYAGRALLISDAPVRSAIIPGRLNLIPPGGKDYESNEDLIRARVVAEAKKLVGVPYSPLDYVALALVHLENLLTGRSRPTWRLTKWIRRRVQSSGHMICSQLVDAVYERAGIHLFHDGRLPGDVMPSDLAAWAEDHTSSGVARAAVQD
ncbi:MAG: hypothetical protein JWO98_4751 [Frankiales bacterium]|nr:hypothetical protein [Frankiales bacterium]